MNMTGGPVVGSVEGPTHDAAALGFSRLVRDSLGVKHWEPEHEVAMRRLERFIREAEFGPSRFETTGFVVVVTDTGTLD